MAKRVCQVALLTVVVGAIYFAVSFGLGYAEVTDVMSELKRGQDPPLGVHGWAFVVMQAPVVGTTSLFKTRGVSLEAMSFFGALWSILIGYFIASLMIKSADVVPQQKSSSET